MKEIFFVSDHTLPEEEIIIVLKKVGRNVGKLDSNLRLKHALRWKFQTKNPAECLFEQSSDFAKFMRGTINKIYSPKPYLIGIFLNKRLYDYGDAEYQSFTHHHTQERAFTISCLFDLDQRLERIVDLTCYEIGLWYGLKPHSNPECYMHNSYNRNIPSRYCNSCLDLIRKNKLRVNSIDQSRKSDSISDML